VGFISADYDQPGGQTMPDLNCYSGAAWETIKLVEEISYVSL